MQRRLKVKYTVEFETEIVVEDDNISDVISDIAIPEDAVSKYVEDSFEIVSVRDENGLIVEDFDWENDEN